ncbi:MAG: sulfite exporter TauE/SafE family protein [Candidatus Eisenbacteria bacterium]|nr:sulfite exporter TauE/SafE family protein [Candidatus Eisenbacteria bacterium]
MVELQFWQYALFGVAAAAYATIIGLGGGFLVVPFLVLLCGFSPQQAVATSLLVIFANAASGNVSFHRQKRIDLATGWRFGLASVPGSLIGVWISREFTSAAFERVFGLLLAAVAVFLLVKPVRKLSPHEAHPGARVGLAHRRIQDASGNVYEYSFNMRLGLAVSFLAGIISSLFGVGGGIVYVPALVYLFNFPPHLATATSFFVLLISAVAGAVFHGMYQHTVYSVGIYIGVGAAVGAQVGAALSTRIKGHLLIRLFAVAVLFVALRLLVG